MSVRAAAPLVLSRQVVVAFSAAAVGAGLGRALVTTYLPVLLERIRDAPGLIGTVMLVNTVAGFAVPLAAGVWSDRLRERGHSRTGPLVVGGSLLAGGGLLAVALGSTSSYLALAAFAAVTYVGLNAVTTGHRALIPQSFSDDDRGRVTAGEEVAMLGGTLLGVVVGGVLVEQAGWAPFLAGAVLVPLLALPTARAMRARERSGPPRPRHGWGSYRAAIAHPGSRRVLLAQALWVAGYVGLPPFFVLYAERELSLRPSAAAVVLAAFGGLGGLAMVLAGRLPAAERRRWLRVGAGTMGGGMLLAAGAGTLAAVAPALVLVSAGFGVVSTLGFPVFATFIAPGEEGAGSAAYFAVRSVSSAVAVPAAGWTIDLTGSYRALFLAGGLVTLAALVPLRRLDGAGLSPRGRAAASRALGLAGLTAALLLITLAVEHSFLRAADVWLFEAYHGLGRTPRLVDDLVVDPHLRNYAIVVALCGLVARDPRAAVKVAAGGLVAYAAVRACWALWERARPEESLGTLPANGHEWAGYPSFPSGHAAVATALATAGTIVVPRLWPALWGFAGVVAWTRVSYGAHFPTDVAAGLALGVAGGAAAALPAGASLPRPRLPAWRLAHVAGGASVLAAAAGLALALVGDVPAAPEGGVLDGATVHDVQVGLAALAAALALLAVPRPSAGAPLLLVAAALGVLAAVEHQPGAAALAYLLFAVPAVLHLRRLRADRVLAVCVTGVSVAAAGAAAAVHHQVYGPTHPESVAARPADGVVRWLWAGGVTTDRITVVARLTRPGTAQLVVGGRRSAPARSDPQRIVRLRLDGLRPGALHRWRVEVDGVADASSKGATRTFPEGRASFTVALGGCARVGSNGAVFDAIAEQRPALFIATGDLFYANIDANDRGRFIDAYRRLLTRPGPAALARGTPFAYIWDDHDFGGNGSDRTAPSRDAALAAYARAVPHYPTGAPGSINQAFSVGRVRFVLLDTRSSRTPASTPDGPAKTMLGAAQRRWLERELLRARDRAALTVVVSSVPWIGEPRDGDDSWAGYATERAALSTFVARHRIDRLVMLAGDAHMVAADDGSHTDYSGTGRGGFPLLHAAALDRPGGVKGGPYSEGAFGGAGQFGTLEVRDRGKAVEVVLRGLRHDGRVLLEHRFSRAVGALR